MSDSLRPDGLQHARLLCPWDSPGKNTGVGWQALLQGIVPIQGSNTCFLCLLHWQVGSFPRVPHLGSSKPFWKVKVKSLSCVWLFVTPWTVPYQAPPSMGFSRKEYQSGLPFPLPNLKPTLRSQTDDMKHVSFTYHWHHQMSDRSCYVWSGWAFWCLIWYTGTWAPGPDPPGWIQSSRPGPVCPCKNSPRGRKRHGPCVQSESEKNKHQGGDQVRSVLTLKGTGPPLFLL